MEAETSTVMEKTITSRLTRLLNMQQIIQAQLSTLKAHSHMYIGDSLRIGSNTILEGESGVTIKLAKGLPVWGGRESSISDEKAMLMIKGNSATDVTIRNLTVDGSQSDYYPNVTLGTSCYNMATLIGSMG